MTEALIGLIGVIAGALLGGVVSVRVERRKQRRIAFIAGLLVSGELEDARGKIFSARFRSAKLVRAHQAPTWWLGDLPTSMWSLHAQDLAVGGLDPKVLEDIKRLYTNFVSLDAQRAIQATPDKKVRRELSREFKAIGVVTNRLNEDIKRLRRSPPLWKYVVWPLALIAVVVVGVEVVAIPHVDLDSTTVAAALESPLGDNVFVRCNADGSNWSCLAYPLSKPRASCPLVATSSFDYPIPRQYIDLAATTTMPVPCKETGAPCQLEASDDSKELVASVVSAGSCERMTNLNYILTPRPERSGWRKLLGLPPN